MSALSPMGMEWRTCHLESSLASSFPTTSSPVTAMQTRSSVCTPATRESKVQTGSRWRASSAFDRTAAPERLSTRSVQVLPVALAGFAVKPTRAGQPAAGGGPDVRGDLASLSRRRFHASTECSNASASSGSSVDFSPVSRSTHPTIAPSAGVAVEPIEGEALPPPHGHAWRVLRRTRRPLHFSAPAPLPRRAWSRTRMAQMSVSTETQCLFASRSSPRSTACGSSMRTSRHGTFVAHPSKSAGVGPCSGKAPELAKSSAGVRSHSPKSDLYCFPT